MDERKQSSQGPVIRRKHYPTRPGRAECRAFRAILEAGTAGETFLSAEEVTETGSERRGLIVDFIFGIAGIFVVCAGAETTLAPAPEVVGETPRTIGPENT